ncbi:unnamed protein product [Bursaphelenchus xylophilus]|uniref:(pine wood nematode) hypothetical protein n=1 Tax=Bursaphelenchus xylophilus TaxID=6326 RepID=A0A1I7SQ67_BURXY|nr:unnamed protein product [Bursaphelenchus xylophilus]CAG9109660.1 unnamed protein product [Bursaphelenchus xylophilus]
MALSNELEVVLIKIKGAIYRDEVGAFPDLSNQLVDTFVANYRHCKIGDDVIEALKSLAQWMDIQTIENFVNIETGTDLVENLKSAINNSQVSDEDIEEKEDLIDPNDQLMGIDDLVKQLSLRNVPRFEPEMPEFSSDSEDDDSEIKVSELNEHRLEKKGSQTAEHEVERHSDGRTVTTKKFSTSSSSRTSSTRTIKISGSSIPEDIMKRLQNEKVDFDGDETEDKEITIPNSMDMIDNEMEDDCHTKTKTVQHNEAVLQAVKRQAKTNGRIKLDQQSRKLDTMDLNAKQIDYFEGDKLVDRHGGGLYQEHSIIQNKINDETEEYEILLPVKRISHHTVKTIEDDQQKGGYFKAVALESYIKLNDNLRCFEEQKHTEIHYSFGLSGVRTTDHKNLMQLMWYEGDCAVEGAYDETAGKQPLPNSLPEHVDVLEAYDASDYLILREKEGQEVYAGPINALVVHSTHPKSSLLYQEAFLFTFPGFIESSELIKRLLHRFSYMNALDSADSHKAAKQTFSVLARLLNQIGTAEFKPEFVTQINQFISKLLNLRFFDAARLLRKFLSKKLGSLFDSCNISVQDDVKSKYKHIFKVKSADIAKQLTYLDSEMMSKISTSEILWWASNQSSRNCKNIFDLTKHFNDLSFWIRAQILKPDSQKDREKRFEKFLKVAKALRRLNNFNSYLAVISALDSGPVKRLDWPKSLKKQIAEMVKIMDSRQSFTNYRSELNNAKPPLIPYFGLILQDLTFVNVGNPDYLPGRKDMLNFGKRWQQYAILDSVDRLTRWRYDIKPDQDVLGLFAGFKEHLVDEGWTRSYAIERRRD